MTPGKKYTFFTALFYLMAFPLTWWLADRYPGGPCVPGLGILFELLFVIMMVIGVCISLVGLVRGKRSFRGPAIINVTAAITLIVLVSMG